MSKQTKPTTEKGIKKLYRYEIEYSNADDPDTRVNLIEHPVIRETEHSYFIKPTQYPVLSNKLKRVSKTAYNTFAYDNKKDARIHFQRRTMKRISWYEYWTEQCEKALELSKEIKDL